MLRTYDDNDTSHHLTPEKMERLKMDLLDLEKTQRPLTVDDLSQALKKGDLSENAEYQDAKARLARIDGRVFSIKERLKNAIVIERGPSESGDVRIGSTVLLSVNGHQREYQILGSQETNPARGRISHLSPLGSALLGHAAGETVTVTAENGTTAYGIIRVT